MVHIFITACCSYFICYYITVAYSLHENDSRLTFYTLTDILRLFPGERKSEHDDDVDDATLRSVKEEKKSCREWRIR